MQYRDPTEQFFPKISITLIAIGLLICFFNIENEEKEEELEQRDEPYQYNDNIYYDKKNQDYNNGYLHRTNNAYNTQKDMGFYYNLKDNTQSELNKLDKTKEFNEMCSKKGNDWKNNFISFNNKNIDKLK